MVEFKPRQAALYLGLSVLALLILLKFSDTEKVLQTIGNLNIFEIAILLGFVLLSLLLRVYRWSLLLKSLAVNVEFTRAARPFLVGQALSLVTPGKVGDFARCWLLKGYKIRESFGSVIIERGLDFALLIAMALIYILNSGGTYLLPVLLIFGGLLFVAATFSSRRLAHLIFGTISGTLSRFLAVDKYRAPISKVYHKVRRSLKHREFYYAIPLGLVIWGIEFLRMYILTVFLGSPVDFFTMAQIYSLSIILGVATLLPGGIGGFEAAFAFLLIGAGYPLFIAASMIVMERVIAFWFVIAVGMVAFYTKG